MARLVKLVPAREGLSFPMPNGLDFPEDGIVADADDLFWARRILDEDVVIAEEPAAEDAASAAEPAKKRK